MESAIRKERASTDRMQREPLIQTGSQTVGPFFHYALIAGEDQRILVTPATRGEHIRIEGCVYDGDGALVPDAMLEIWQADAAGIFNHPADPRHREADPAFRGFGRSDTTGAGSRFWFHTVKPGGRSNPDGSRSAPYIDVYVFSRGMLLHALTRVYFADEAGNEADPVFAALDATRRQTLLAHRINWPGRPCFRFDVHLQGSGETLFFNF
jgi:protocatechuate 3,4-dioxygenase alpha subunit